MERFAPVSGAIRPSQWGDSPQSVGRFAPVSGAIRPTLISRGRKRGRERMKAIQQPHAGCCREAAAHCTTLPLSGRPNRCEELQPPARSADDSHSIASELCVASPP